MTKSEEIIRNALDTLALALATHNHKWTKEERKLYEWASRILDATEQG